MKNKIIERFVVWLKPLCLGLVFCVSTSLYAQEKNIAGVVISKVDNQPMPFLNVLLKELSPQSSSPKGVSTDMDGKFQITANVGDTLVFSYVGMKTQKIVVGSQATVNVTLQQENVSLNEVVVVGYGTMKKKNVTGSMSSVKAEDIQNMPVYGVDQALQGRATGVQVTQSSGSPGSAAMVRVRGVGTVGNSNPLYVVDGLPMSAESANNINPGDIERVDILKDAAAAAVYGTRAANGVILITTKKGKAGKTSLTFDSYTGIQSPLRTPKLANAKQFAQIYNASGGTVPFTQSEIDALGDGTNWWDEVLSPAPMSSYQLTASGGSDKGVFLISGNYFSQDGIMTNSNYSRLTARVNSEIKVVNDYVKIGENLSLGQSKRRPSLVENDEYDGLGALYAMDPTVKPYNENPDPSIEAEYGSNKWSTSTRTTDIANPVGMIERRNEQIKQIPIIGSGYMTINPLKGLELKSLIGVNLNMQEYQRFDGRYYESGARAKKVNSMEQSMAKYSSWEWFNTATYEKTIKTNHYFKIMGGYSRSQYYGRRLDITMSGVSDNPDFWYPESGVDSLNKVQSSDPLKSRMASYFGRVNYVFKDKYLFESSFRRDGSSKFGANKRYGFFPSFSAGWIISEEEFFKSKFTNVNMLKLRGGFGALGNDQIKNYAYTALITPYYDYYTLGADQSKIPGATSYGLPNPDVHWETTHTKDLGLDVALWENKWQFTLDFFQKKTTDVLLYPPVQSYSGIVDLSPVNLGVISNKGLEFDATYRKAEGKFNYSTTFNFSTASNKLVELADGLDQLSSNKSSRLGDVAWSSTRVGLPISSFYGFKTDGLFQNASEIAASAQPTAQPGDMRYVDVNGDGKITDDDKTNIGSPFPKFTYGISADAKYKRWDVVIFLQGSYGAKILNQTKFYTYNNRFFNHSADMLNAWTPTNTNTNIPRIDSPDYIQNLYFSDFMIESGSYLRFKNMQIGYTLPEGLLKKLYIQKLRLYVAAQNIFTITKYTGNNPEVGLKPGYGEAADKSLDYGVDRGFYPLARTILFGINASF